MTGLVNKLNSMRENQASNFDPVRFRYLESMARQAGEQKESVGKILEKKTLIALEEYQADFLRAREAASSSVTRISTGFPGSAENIRQLFDNCEFREVKRVAAGLGPAANNGGLSALCKPLIPVLSPLEVTENPGDLKAVRRFRQSIEARRINKLINRAIAESPQDSGPLNPQMLAIRSLATMRALSPKYLNRFATYIDTLLWLAQADEEMTGKKKTRPLSLAFSEPSSD